jgi:hypothetical protein
LATFHRWGRAARRMIPPGLLDHLLTDLSLKFLRLTAEFIELI